MLDDALSYILHNYRELVTSDMGMCIYQYRFICSETHELMEDFAYVTSLRRTGIKLSIRKSTCTTFSETIVGIRIDNTFT